MQSCKLIQAPTFSFDLLCPHGLNQYLRLALSVKVARCKGDEKRFLGKCEEVTQHAEKKAQVLQAPLLSNHIRDEAIYPEAKQVMAIELPVFSCDATKLTHAVRAFLR